MGDNFSNKVSELDVYLSACLNLNLEKKVKTCSSVKYTSENIPRKEFLGRILYTMKT